MLLDRLLISALIEARSCERFALLADGLDSAELRGFYRGLMESEARHYRLFCRLAEQRFGFEATRARLATLAAREAEVPGVSAEALARRIRHADVQPLGGVEQAAEALLELLRPGDVLLTLGAGDGYRVGELVLDRLRAAFAPFDLRRRSAGQNAGAAAREEES